MLFFSRFEILKLKEYLNTDDYRYPVHQLILPSPNSHSTSFHVSCIILSNFLTLYFPFFTFFLINHNREQVNQMSLMKDSLFCERSTVDQLNLEAERSEKEK